MDHLGRHRTIDLLTPHAPDPQLDTDMLFGDARGKMFGVMECLDQTGATVILRAFSGQYNGLWQVPGWVGPLFDLDTFGRVNNRDERRIKGLGAQLATLPPHSSEWLTVKRQRRELSRDLMARLHNLYRLTNFHGNSISLHEAYAGNGGLPTGIGDCCAPKLLNHAANHNLIPLGLSEFYWGRDNKAGTRQHTKFYPACSEKCQPILGHLLCGLEEKQRNVPS